MALFHKQINIIAMAHIKLIFTVEKLFLYFSYVFFLYLLLLHFNPFRTEEKTVKILRSTLITVTGQGFQGATMHHSTGPIVNMLTTS